jgi:hypothetical protein
VFNRSTLELSIASFVFTLEQLALPIHKRYEIVFLSQHKLEPKLGYDRIGRLMKCDKSTVKYCIERFWEDKDLTVQQKSERPRATSSKQDDTIIQLADSDKDLTSSEIQGIL